VVPGLGSGPLEGGDIAVQVHGAGGAGPRGMFSYAVSTWQEESSHPSSTTMAPPLENSQPGLVKIEG
jgi:hypothetical protein